MRFHVGNGVVYDDVTEEWTLNGRHEGNMSPVVASMLIAVSARAQYMEICIEAFCTEYSRSGGGDECMGAWSDAVLTDVGWAAFVKMRAAAIAGRPESTRQSDSEEPT